MNKPIFTLSGLRGVFGDDLIPELVLKYASSFGHYLQGKNIAVGRDTRASGLALFHAVASGLFYHGYDVYDFGICPTPAIVMMVKKLGLDGGIQITASHNPEKWNGLKFISKNGTALFPSEIIKIKHYLNTKNSPYALKHYPTIHKREITQSYLKNIVKSKFFKKIPVKKFKVGIDSCNGAAEDAAIQLVRMLGATPITIRKSDIGFPRTPEPKGENLKELCSAVRKQKLDLGIAFDPDGDRFSCVDELGIPLSEEASILLALLFILRQEKGPVVVNNSTTMAVEEICKGFNVPVYRSKVGEISVVQKMQEVDAIVGGEGNGGVIIPEINSARDGLVATAIVLKLLSKMNCTLSDIRKQLPKYYMKKIVINNFRKDWKETIKNRYVKNPSYKIDTQEGLKISGKDFWVIIRKSNTEPLLRIIAESPNNILTNKVIDVIIKQIRK